MSDQSEQPWSDGPNAPNIPYWLFIDEKASFIETGVYGMSYGIVLVLFFQCMRALFNPANGMKWGNKWGLVIQAVAMFSFFTVPIVIALAMESDSYIDNREFPGDSSGDPPGPLGYPGPSALTIIYTLGFRFNQLVADGFLLYRCLIIYSMNYWAIAFPFVMYVFTIVSGIFSTYEEVVAGNFQHGFAVDIYTSYASVSLALNVILTLMIIIRLILHNRSMRKVIGASETASGLYRTIITILVESFSLYAVTFFVYILLRAFGNFMLFPFAALTSATLVIAPLLMIKRVADRRAITSDVISGNIVSIQFKNSEESSGGGGSIPEDVSVGAADTRGEVPSENTIGVGNRNIIEEVQL